MGNQSSGHGKDYSAAAKKVYHDFIRVYRLPGFHRGRECFDLFSVIESGRYTTKTKS
uniref:Uncharacterized protein n=1 Tax=Magallana gigas TaxID=29159 RepID=K1P9G5_MAGGI